MADHCANCGVSKRSLAARDCRSGDCPLTIRDIAARQSGYYEIPHEVIARLGNMDPDAGVEAIGRLISGVRGRIIDDIAAAGPPRRNILGLPPIRREVSYERWRAENPQVWEPFSGWTRDEFVWACAVDINDRRHMKGEWDYSEFNKHMWYKIGRAKGYPHPET